MAPLIRRAATAPPASWRDTAASIWENDDMAINYDPSDKAKPTPEMVEMAKTLNYHIVNVLCFENQDADADDNEGMSFLSLCPTIPRIGEKINLEDGKSCIVRRVVFKAVTQRAEDGKAIAVLLV